jgi:hypothetical protein
MWTETEPFDFEGRFYRLRGAVCEPKPIQRPHPPIMIGAAGTRSLRVVAEHADLWNCPTRGDVAEFTRLSSVLDEHCESIRRDPGEIERSVQLVVAPRGSSALPGGMPRFADPDETRDRLLAFIDAGATHLVLAPVLSDAAQPAHWLAADIVEPVLQQLGQMTPSA